MQKKEHSFNFKKFDAARKNFLKANKDESFVIIEGNIPFILSAPHGVSQVRLGKNKFRERGSLALALEVQKRTGAHLIAKTKNCGDDANFDEICPYKEELKRYIKEKNIKFLIDFHGMKKERPIHVNIGTNFGRNVQANVFLLDYLIEKLKQEKFITEIDNPFVGNRNTVAGTIAEKLGIWTIQLEVNYEITNDNHFLIVLERLIKCLQETIEKSIML